MSIKVACVTGASGLIGRCIIPLLLSSGYKVRALVRASPVVAIDGVDYYSGDIGDVDFLKSFMKSAAAVYHCAAELKDESKMWEVNVLGSQKIADASRCVGVEYFCFISSAGVVGLTRESEIFEETDCHPRNMYERSKLAAEKVILSSKPASKLVILRPTNVVDRSRPGVVGQAVKRGFLERLKFIFKGAECAHLVHAEDVAAAAIYFSGNIDTSYGACYFVSIDDDPDNSFSGIWRAVNNDCDQVSCSGVFHLPIFIPYWVRILVGRKANKGDVKYSSARLISAGYNYKYTIGKMVVAFCKGDDN